MAHEILTCSIGVLPPSYDTTIYFTAEDLAELQDDKAVGTFACFGFFLGAYIGVTVEAVNAQKLLQQMYADVAPILAEWPKLFPPEHFTFDLFKVRFAARRSLSTQL